jgi:hypothetical protein
MAEMAKTSRRSDLSEERNPIPRFFDTLQSRQTDGDSFPAGCRSPGEEASWKHEAEAREERTSWG